MTWKERGQFADGPAGAYVDVGFMPAVWGTNQGG
jgi:hypothetical protein